MNRIRKRLIGTVLVLLGMLALAGTAEASAPVLPTISEHGNYCYFYAPTETMACVEHETDSIYAKAASLGIPPSSALSAKSASILAGPYNLGTFYKDSNYQGNWIIWQDDHDCTTTSSDIDSLWSNTGAWMDEISSFKRGSACIVKVWSNVNATGASLAWAFQRSELDVLNDHVWSVQFT